MREQEPKDIDSSNQSESESKELLAEFQRVRDELAQGRHSIEEWDAWIDEVSYPEGRFFPTTIDEAADFILGVTSRISLAEARLIKYEKFPIDVLTRKTREKYEYLKADQKPTLPHIISEVKLSSITGSFEEYLKNEDVHTYVSKRELSTNVIYFQSCTPDEFMNQLRRTNPDSVQDQE